MAIKLPYWELKRQAAKAKGLLLFEYLSAEEFDRYLAHLGERFDEILIGNRKEVKAKFKPRDGVSQPFDMHENYMWRC